MTKPTIAFFFFCFSWLLMNQPLFSQNFVTDWDLSLAAGSGTDQIIFFKDVTSSAANYTWQQLPSGSSGSGTIPVGAGNFTLSGLPPASIIRLSIAPTNLKRFATNNLSDAPRLKDVRTWGAAAWNNMGSAFYGASNMTMSATGVPNLASVNNMSSMFENATTFNKDISNWNTNSVIFMNNMFRNASAFNQDISDWSTNNVNFMGSMFSGTSAFNQPIGTWNTARVINMDGMFANASAFNQNISTWNISNVTSMSIMFLNATAFNQDIGTWILDSNIDMNNMLNNSGMDCNNYSNTLIGWEANNPTVTGRRLGVAGRTYNNAGLTARNSLVSRGWTITGDAACAVLPIEWIDFKAQKQANGNLLTWNVVATNQDYFEIERSSDNLNFQYIGQVKASDNEKYEYLDNTSNNNSITYYRIKAVEYDETSNYSKIISISNGNDKTISLYPNPTNNEFFLENVKDKTNYQISNLLGAVVVKGITNANNSINIQDLKNGVYFLQIEGKILRLVVNQ